MRRLLIFALPLFLFASCAVIPKETVTLSQSIGSDIEVLHTSHRNMVQLYYGKIKDNINTFVDDVYAPYIIHYVLESELKEYKQGNPSLYTSIENAGTKGGKEYTEQALSDMTDFCEAATEQINKKRSELLSPVVQQEKELLRTIDESYQNTLYANATLTAYLSSARKAKESQDKALSAVGLGGLNDKAAEHLVELSDYMDELLKKSREIDVKSTEAQEQIEDIISKYKDTIKQ